MREQLRNIGLAGVLTLSGGGIAEAQSPEPTPLVEQVKLDVSPMIEGLDARVDFSQEPHFFNRMKRLAQRSPNEHFQLIKGAGDKPNTASISETWLYFPDGFTGTPKAGFIFNQTSSIGHDTDGIPSQVEQIFQVTDWYLDLGEGGKLANPNGTELYSWKQQKQNANRFFDEPRELTKEPWIKQQLQFPSMFAQGNTAGVRKVWARDEEFIEGTPAIMEGWLMQDDQLGIMHMQHFERIIPSLQGGDDNE